MEHLRFPALEEKESLSVTDNCKIATHNLQKDERSDYMVKVERSL